MDIKTEFKTVGFFYIQLLLFWLSIGFMGGYWVLYLSTLGVSYSQISFILLMYPIATVLFEIPTGVIADIYGRKASVSIAYILMGSAFAIFILSRTNFWLLVLSEFMSGVALTFETGALQAWFVDTIKHKNQTKYRQKLFGKWGFYGSIGFITGTLIGGFVVRYGIAVNFWITAIGMLALAGYTLIFGKEEYFKKEKVGLKEDIKESFKVAKAGFKLTKRNKTVLTFGMVLFVLTLGNTISFDSYQTYVVEAGLHPQYIEWAFSIAGVILLITYAVFHKITKLLGGNRNTLVFYALMMGLSILGICVMNTPALIFLCMIGYTAFGEFAAKSPAYNELLNKNTPSKIRATVVNINSFFGEVGGFIGLVLFGIISDISGVKNGVLVGGIAVIISSLIYLRIKEKKS